MIMSKKRSRSEAESAQVDGIEKKKLKSALKKTTNTDVTIALTTVVGGKNEKEKGKKSKFAKSTNTNKNIKKHSLSEKSKQAITKAKNKNAPQKGKTDVKIEEMTKKQKKIFFKSKKNNFELITKAKQIWEVFRNSKYKSDVLENAQQLYNLIKGHANQVVYSHDTSRVIESLMSLGPRDIKDAIYDELKTEIVKMAQSKYAKFYVISVLRHGKKEQKAEVIALLTKDVVRLMKHTEAALVVETAFNEFATTTQRRLMLEPFYGAAYLLHKPEGEHAFATIMKNPSRRAEIIDFLKKALMDMVQKSVISYSFVHKLLLDFFEYCNETDRNEMIEAIKMSVLQILHTRDGSRVGMKCVWYGGTKVRSKIIKSFKTHVTKICKEKQGHLVLLAIFDCVDDTVVVDKIIIQEIVKNIKEIISYPEGNKVITYLLASRNHDFTAPGTIDILKEGDSNTVSKKDPEVRRRELLTHISKPVVNYFMDHAKELVLDAYTTKLSQAILRYCVDSRRSLLDKVVEITVQPFVLNEEEHVIDHSIGHSFLKQLIKYDKHIKENSQIDHLFCEALMKALTREIILTWVNCNRGAFIIVSLIETGVEDVVAKIKDLLEGSHDHLASKSFSGAEILLKKLKSD